MQDVLEPHELSEQLHEGLQRASGLQMPYVRVTLRVPYGSRYVWHAEEDDHLVHVPTAAWVHPVEFRYPHSEDGGPAATWLLKAEGAVPSEEVCEELAHDLFARSIAWAMLHYGDIDEPYGDLPELPASLERYAQHALGGVELS